MNKLSFIKEEQLSRAQELIRKNVDMYAISSLINDLNDIVNMTVNDIIEDLELYNISEAYIDDVEDYVRSVIREYAERFYNATDYLS